MTIHLPLLLVSYYTYYTNLFYYFCYDNFDPFYTQAFFLCAINFENINKVNKKNI